jgi:hypothetical protein
MPREAKNLAKTDTPFSKRSNELIFGHLAVPISIHPIVDLPQERAVHRSPFEQNEADRQKFLSRKTNGRPG